MSEKIQKILANAGLGSRRQIETWLTDKRISINGIIAKLGDRIEGTEHISIDGRDVKLVKTHTKKSRILLYHKPEGEICSRSDPEGRPTVFDRLPLLRNSRWITVGRLDFNTSGILLLTNDGDLANRLMHPSSEIEREYAVRVKGEVSPAMLTKLRKGVKLEDGYAQFNTVVDAGGEGTNHWYHVVVKEGRNRVVRRLWESQNIVVSRLIRIRFGMLELPREVRRGKWKELDHEEVMTFMQSVKRKPEAESTSIVKK